MTASVEHYLTRLLGLVPYAYEHPGVSLDDAAADFGLSREQLIDDLNLLWLVGKPGGYHDDLIDVAYEDGYLSITNAEEVSYPVKLTAREAQSLLVGLNYLKNFDDFDQAALASLSAKLSGLTGIEPAAGEYDFDGLDTELFQLVRTAQARGQALEIDYYVAARDELTHRTISPVGIKLAGSWQIEAYCHQAQAYRRFAVENVYRPQLVDAPGSVPEATHGLVTTPGTNSSQEQSARKVRLTLDQAAAWVVDEVIADDVEYDTTGTVTLTMTVLSDAWLTRFLLTHGRHVVWFSDPDFIGAMLADEGTLRWDT